MNYQRFLAGIRRMRAGASGARMIDRPPVRETSTIDEEAFAWGKLQAKTEAMLAALDEFGI
jgi:hypothetical protein